MGMKAKEFGLELTTEQPPSCPSRSRTWSPSGYVFEAADASLELLMRRATGWEQTYFSFEAYRVSSYHREGSHSRSGA